MSNKTHCDNCETTKMPYDTWITVQPFAPAERTGMTRLIPYAGDFCSSKCLADKMGLLTPVVDPHPTYDLPQEIINYIPQDILDRWKQRPTINDDMPPRFLLIDGTEIVGPSAREAYTLLEAARVWGQADRAGPRDLLAIDQAGHHLMVAARNYSAVAR